MGSDGCFVGDCSLVAGARVSISLPLVVVLVALKLTRPSTHRRSGLATTIAQLASRILVVWYVCPFYPQVSPSVCLRFPTKTTLMNERWLVMDN
jgi:hypothetical protein